MFRCVAAIANKGGQILEHFYPDTPEGHASAEAFAVKHNCDGWGVYDCVSPLKVARRSKETVAQIVGLHADIDARDLDIPKAEIAERVRTKLQTFGILSRLTDSGRGMHAYALLNEPIEAGTPEAAEAEALLQRMCAHLGADPAPAHFAAYMRRPGTMNSKEGAGPCEVLVDTGARCELSDIAAYLDLVEEVGPLFTRKPKDGNGPTQNFKNSGAPVDVEAELAAMEYEGKDGNGVNATVCRVIASLLRRGEHPGDVLERVVTAIMEMADRSGLGWGRGTEVRETRKRILSTYNNLLLKGAGEEIPDWMPGEFHEQWARVVQEGHRPCFRFNRGGFLVRAPEGAKAKASAQGEPAAGADPQPSPKRVLVLRPFVSFDPATLPPRQWLYARHYQRRTVSLTAGPGGTGKSSLVLVECVAMATARNLLGEQPTERLRVWLHNGEDPMEEILRRLAAICLHYKIPQAELEGQLWLTSGNEFPLRVAKGYANLEINTALVRQISCAIGDNRIDLAAFDPLVTLHSVSEGDPGKMDAVVRLFAGIADEHDAAIELNHHVRKPAAGTDADHDVHDIRGVMAITDAVRAARVLNRMNQADAESAGIDETARQSYFRVDKAKGNYSPAQAATWRRFASIDLPNTDSVGVVEPWEFPGQDGVPSPERQKVEQKAEYIFLEVLRRLFLAGRFVGEKGTYNAPHVIAKEREAKAARVGKAALDAAMRRLFDKGKIRIEEYTMANRHPGTRIVEV